MNNRAHNRTRSIASHGFTLVEVIVSMVVISIAVLGITGALTFGLRHQSDGLWQVKSVMLAQSYIEEITSRRFDEQTPIGGIPACSPATNPCSSAAAFDDGETRALFDDVDDYDGVDDLPPVDANGSNRSGYDGYRVQISVDYASAAQIAAFGLSSSEDAKIVVVTVTPPAGSPMSFSAIKANF